MGKQWLVKNSGRKATQLRKEPQSGTDANVVGTIPNGEAVAGEFIFVRRASREVGYVKLTHLKPHIGHSWKVSKGGTLLRRKPLESSDSGNAAGYANEGELVDGEFIFVTRKGGGSGFVKRRHLKADASEVTVAAQVVAAQVVAAHRPATPLRLRGQCWVVMDSHHDGAWLRRAPREERGPANVVRLVPNGDTVIGDFVFVRDAAGEQGFVKFKHLEQQAAGVWRIRNAVTGARTLLRRAPTEAFDKANSVAVLEDGDMLDGEYVYVHRKDGKHAGYVKRRHLTAMVTRPESASSLAAASSGAALPESSDPSRAVC